MGGACDAVLVVVDSSYESIRLATTVSRMLEPATIPLHLVFNKTNANSSQALRSALQDSARIIGEFLQDRIILEAGLEGRSLPVRFPATAAILEKIDRI
jgi:CO dehydrogenase maturation factor